MKRFFLGPHELWLIVIAAGLFGCSREPYPYSQISGTVRYDSGEAIPAARLIVTLIPQVEAINNATRPQAGQAEVESDGSFKRVTSRTYGDGAVRGRHKVTVIAVDENERPTTAVPALYAQVATTPLEFDTAQTPWEVVIPKPTR